MPTLTPADLLKIYPEIDFLVAEGTASSNYMIAIHTAFYRFAAAQITGGTVLDAGCGTGFGTAMLTQKAQLTVGIDIKDRLIDYARQNYQQEGLRFEEMDVGHIGYPDNFFDVIIADELLEHLPDHRPFMNEVMRLLKDDGLFICATVNGNTSFGTADNPLNRNHFREFYPHSFGEELGSWFKEVSVVSQGLGQKFEKYMYDKKARWIEWLLMRLKIKHRIPAAWRARIRSLLTGVAVSTVKPEEFMVTDHLIQNSPYLVATARGKKIVTPKHDFPKPVRI